MSWLEYFDFESSNISALRYHEDDQILEVAFNRGGVYHYFGVPHSIWQGMKDAESKGSYLHTAVKGSYRYSKV